MDEIVEQTIPSGSATAMLDSPIEDGRPAEPIDPEHAAIVERGREQAQRGEFASADAVEAAFRRAGP